MDYLFAIESFKFVRQELRVEKLILLSLLLAMILCGIFFFVWKSVGYSLIDSFVNEWSVMLQYLSML